MFALHRAQCFFHPSSEWPVFSHSLYKYWLSTYSVLGPVRGGHFHPGLCSYGAFVLCSGGKTVSKYTIEETDPFRQGTCSKRNKQGVLMECGLESCFQQARERLSGEEM